ncbi:TetR/AcrR family transcriptional regulator [Leucobacter tenebrionis]|uniref:TetR/AcrR family transcriptional regulator n=1 Tax=Leucobacter tenebrionis TaxID=2873270 RepID=UPI001CA786E8|nr:TetR/AcrR family transcriptional regulator [Leucobacter tenebrionis]QZY50665.1 TetR/AcrR family transcriptional regulator [Leucobacter tenebrionis]
MVEAATEQAGARRVRLDQRTIVDAMLQLARDEPHTRITFKRLGEALGVDATAMYRHFRNKDELTRAALDRITGWATDTGRESSGTWRERLEAHLMRTAELALEYPSIGAEGAVIDPVGPGDTSAVEFMLEMLAESGLRDEALLQAYAAVSGFTLSQSAALAHDVLRNPEAARDGSEPWISTFGSINLSEYPLVNRHRDALLAMDGMTVFRAGIAAILDAVELAAGRSPDPHQPAAPRG